MAPPVLFATKLYNELDYNLTLKIADILTGEVLGNVNTTTGLAEVPGNQVVGFVEMVRKIDSLLAAGGYSNAV